MCVDVLKQASVRFVGNACVHGRTEKGMFERGICLSRAGLVLSLGLLDALLERLGLVELRGCETIALGGGDAVRVPHAVSDGTLVGRSGSVEFGVVLARVGVGALHLLPIGRTGEAGTLIGFDAIVQAAMGISGEVVHVEYKRRVWRWKRWSKTSVYLHQQ